MQPRADDLLDACIRSGINAFDHGWIYKGGAPERAFGNWVRERGNRDEIVVEVKGCHQSSERKRVTVDDLRSDVEESLRRLRLDYLDLWLFHRDDPAQPVGPLVFSMVLSTAARFGHMAHRIGACPESEK